MGTSKTEFKVIDDYIAKFPKETRDLMEELRQLIKEAAPEAEETISYGIPTFKINGKALVYFGAWKNHVGFYTGISAIEAFKEELNPYRQAKGTIQFPLNKPIPHDLVKKIVKFKIKTLQKTKQSAQA